MKTKVLDVETESIELPKRDIIQAWSVLEKLTVSLRKIGSHFSLPAGQIEQSPESRAAMLDELDRFISLELFKEIGSARMALLEHLPPDEAEYLSELVIQYWKPTPPSHSVPYIPDEP